MCTTALLDPSLQEEVIFIFKWWFSEKYTHGGDITFSILSSPYFYPSLLLLIFLLFSYFPLFSPSLSSSMS
jgi:hypothetical protein